MKTDNLYLNPRFIAINFFIWVSIFIITVSESVFYYQIHDRPTPWVRILVYDAFILVWAMITPAIYMALSLWHHNKKNWKVFLIKLFVVGMGMCLIIIAAESIIQYTYQMSVAKEIAYSSVFVQVISFRLHQNAVLYFTIVGVSLAYLEYRKTRELEDKQSELSRQLMEAELNILKGQMRPHFLFNSLHAISALVLKKENDKAITMITKFGDLLREGLRLDRKPWISLGEEIEMTKKYLEIHSIRLGTKFSYNIKAEEAAQQYKVPSLILQPIIENSLIHGITENNNQGNLNIEIQVIKDKLVIEVADDVKSGQKRVAIKEGLGLGNTRKRLSTLFDDSYDLTFGQRKNADGFFTKIIFPLQLK